MTLTTSVNLKIELDPDEEPPPEAKAVQQLQNQLAGVARMSPDELADLWRLALQSLGKRPQQVRQHHRHGRKNG